MKNINGRYVIIEELGKGGFGIVYKVRDLQDSTIPYKALKLFNSDKNPGKFDDFFAEYDYISSIYLPCVVITYDFARIHHIDGEVFNGNYYFYVMEYVDGISLRDYLFIDKKEQSQVLDKIVFNLKWLHGNGYSPGDLRPENIIIKMDREIVFLDLMQNGNIEKEYEGFSSMLADEFSYDADKYWDEADREMLLNNVFSALQGRKKTGSGLIEEPANAVLNGIAADREIRHGLNVNLANFPDEYFILFLSRLRTLLVREGYEIIEVVPNLDMYALIRDLYLKLRENPVYSDNIDAESPLLHSLPSDYNFNDSFDINTAYEIVCSLIRSAASAKKVALFIMNTGHCDKNSLEVLKRAMEKPFRDAFIIFNNKTLTDVSSPEKPLIIDYTNPIGIEYSDGYKKVIDNIFFHEKTGFPGKIFRKNDSPDLLSVLKYIQSLRAGDTAKVIKGGISGYDAAGYQQRIFESLASDKKYFDVLLYMYYMDTPVKNIFLSELTGRSYPAVKNELLSTGIALPCAEDKILFSNELFINMTKSMADALSREDILRLNANIIRVYESHIDALSTNELFSLAYSHYICGNTGPVREFFEKHIVFNRQMSPELSRHKYGWLIKILAENGPTTDPGFDRLLYIVNAIVMDADDKDKWLGKLIKAEDDPDLEDDYKAVIISKLFRHYYVAGESDKMLIQIKKLESLPAAAERADLRFEVIFSRIRYYFRTGDIEKCIGLCRQAMKEDYDDDPDVNIRKLQLYYFYVQYYQGKSQTRQVAAVLSHLYRRAVKTGQSRFIHRAHELYGLYYEKLGLFEKSKMHHKLAVEEAEKFRDYYILTFSYNNLATRESDVNKKIDYLYKALHYAEHSHELRGELIILSNLLAAVETDSFIKIIREYEDIIFSKDFSDHMILEVRLRLYFNISTLLNESSETALLLRIKEITDSIKLQKKYQQTKYLLDLLKVRLRLMIDGWDKKVFGMVFGLLKYPSFEYIDLVLDLLFNQIIKHVSFEEFRSLADKIFSFYKDNQGLFNDDGFFAFYNLAYDGRIDEPRKVIRYVDMYYRNQSNTPFIRDYILLRYAAALKKSGDETYVNYLSCFCNLQKKDRRDVSRIEIGFNILDEIIHAEFPEHYDTILSGVTECSVNPG